MWNGTYPRAPAFPAAVSSGQLAGPAANASVQPQAHAASAASIAHAQRIPAAARRDRAAGAWEAPLPGRHIAPMASGTLGSSAIPPEHKVEMSAVSPQGKAGGAGATVAPPQRPVRAPAALPLHAPLPEEEDLSELFLPQPDPWEALDADIRKRHAALLEELKQLCRQRKAALEAQIRDAIERGDKGLAQLLSDMHRDVDEQFRLLAEHVTRLALEQLEEVWRRPDGPKSGRIAEELAALRRELEAQRAALRRHILDAMRRAGESNCTGLLHGAMLGTARPRLQPFGDNRQLPYTNLQRPLHAAAPARVSPAPCLAKLQGAHAGHG
jgi:hypothetical protein